MGHSGKDLGVWDTRKRESDAGVMVGVFTLHIFQQQSTKFPMVLSSITNNRTIDFAFTWPITRPRSLTLPIQSSLNCGA